MRDADRGSRRMSSGGQSPETPAAAATSGEAERAAPGVFVSHASADRAFAEALASYLEVRGIRCWIAPRDVAPGALYAEAIVNAISEAPALVLVLSESSVASAHVGKELERASSKRRPIFAIRLDQAQLTPAFEYFLSESQWIEVPALGREAAFARLADALRRPGAAPAGAASPRAVPPAARPDPRAARGAGARRRKRIHLLACTPAGAGRQCRRPALDRGAAIRGPEPGARPGILRRRHGRGNPRPARQDPVPEGHRAQFLVPVQGQGRGRARRRRAARRRDAARRQRPKGR